MSKSTLKITLTRSLIGCLKNHQACASGLGLRKIGQTVEVECNSCTRGMIQKIQYMVKVEGHLR